MTTQDAFGDSTTVKTDAFGDREVIRRDGFGGETRVERDCKIQTDIRMLVSLTLNVLCSIWKRHN